MNKREYDERYPGLWQRIEAQRAVSEAGLDRLTEIATMLGGPYEKQGTIERAILWRGVFDLPAFNSAARNKAFRNAWPVIVNRFSFWRTLASVVESSSYSANHHTWKPKEHFTMRRSHKQRVTGHGEKPCKPQAHIIEYLGRTQSLSAWCRELGVSYHMANHRLLEGCTPHEAFTLPKSLHRAMPTFEHDGRLQTLKQWAAETGIPDGTLRDRMRCGRSLSEAILLGQKKNRTMIEYKGKLKSVWDHARDAGMPPGIVHNRFIKMGWTIERALTEPIRPRKKLSTERTKRVNGTTMRGVRASLPPPLVAGHCDLCGEPAEPLHWDHDHDLEDLGFSLVECHRGWLCFAHNTGLGKFGDNLRGVLAAERYLHRAALPPTIKSPVK